MKAAKKVTPKKDTQPYCPRHGDGAGMIPILDDLPIHHRILCVLDYHSWEERHAPRRQHPEGHWLEESRNRDQCGRCGVLR